MDLDTKFFTRRQVRERTGWSLVFIDKHLPRKKIGRKVVILAADLEAVLGGGGVRHAAA